jgi:hypothetical protein
VNVEKPAAVGVECPDCVGVTVKELLLAVEMDKDLI